MPRLPTVVNARPFLLRRVQQHMRIYMACNACTSPCLDTYERLTACCSLYYMLYRVILFFYVYFIIPYNTLLCYIIFCSIILYHTKLIRFILYNIITYFSVYYHLQIRFVSSDGRARARAPGKWGHLGWSSEGQRPTAPTWLSRILSLGPS